MESNTSPSWRGPALLDGEVAGVVDAAGVAQRPAALQARDEERRQRAQRLLSRLPPQHKAEAMFFRLRRRPRLGPTIRNCLFTLFRIDTLNET
jgi:hypothetical protein